MHERLRQCLQWLYQRSKIPFNSTNSQLLIQLIGPKGSVNGGGSVNWQRRDDDQAGRWCHRQWCFPQRESCIDFYLSSLIWVFLNSAWADVKIVTARVYGGTLKAAQQRLFFFLWSERIRLRLRLGTLSESGRRKVTCYDGAIRKVWMCRRKLKEAIGCGKTNFSILTRFFLPHLHCANPTFMKVPSILFGAVCSHRVASCPQNEKRLKHLGQSVQIKRESVSV